MKKVIARISVFMAATCALLVICSTTVGQSKTEASTKYGLGGKQITTKTKSADGEEETQTKYYDAKGKLREHRTEKRTRAGKTVEVEYYDEKERKTKRINDTYDNCGNRTNEQTEHYNDGVLQSGEIIEWSGDELRPKSVKEWDPTNQRYEDHPVDEWMRENYPFIEKGLQLKFGARSTNGCQYALAQNGDGLSTLALNTDLGKISINLPDDLSAGDTFSGTVVAEPAGSSPTERERNQEVLNRYSLLIGSHQIRVADRLFSEVAGNRDEALRLILTDGDGRGRGHVSLRLELPSSAGMSFQFPRLGQEGRPVRIKGPCDGNLKTTHVKIGGADVPLLAESPRQVVARGPVGLAGLTEIQIEENGRAGHAPFRNVAINLSAPKTNLLKGEQTTLTVRVTGLEGIREDLPLELDNKSPTVVRMAGGDEQTITVHAGEVRAGAYSTDRTLTGIRPGGFTILATLWIEDPTKVH